MNISVIIATMNRSDDLRAALGSIAKQSFLPYEVLVIDQSVDDRTRRLVEEFRAGEPRLAGSLRYFFQEEKSLVKARNRGFREASGELITFFDDDVVLFEDYFERMDAFLTAHPDVGAVSGRQILKTKQSGFKWALRKALLRFFLISNCDGRMTPSGFGFPITFEREIDRLIFVEMLAGCNMSFRKQWVEGERFDEWFSGYGYREDAEFSFRISQKTRMAMIPDAKLHHNHSTQNRLNVDKLKRMEIKNHYYVFKKYRYTNFFSNILFGYSLTGVCIMEFLEFLSKRDRQSLQRLKAGFLSFFSVFNGQRPH